MELMHFLLSEKRFDRPFSGVREREAAVIRRRNGGYEVSTMWLYEYFPLSAEVSLYDLLRLLREQGAEFWVFEASAISYTLKLALCQTKGNEETLGLVFWTEYYGIAVVKGGYFYSNDGAYPDYIRG